MQQRGEKVTIISFLRTGTVLFSSKSGSGGGAIELIAENGILTVGKNYKYNLILNFNNL